MASMMEIKSEVLGKCVEEIDVSAEVKYEGRRLCYAWEYLKFI